MDLIVGAAQLDRTIQDVEALIDSYRTDDGLRYLDYQPLTPPPDLARAAGLDGQRLLADSDPRGARLDLVRPHAPGER